MINIGINNTPNEEFIIDIRDKSQVIKARIAIGKDDVHVHKLMSDHYIEFGEFSLPTFELFKRSDYIIWEGEKYIIKEDYQPSEENKFEFKYTLRFDHWTTFLQDATFYYLLQDLEEVEWSLTSNAASHMQHLADNANRYFGVDTFNVGTVEFTDVKYIQYDKTDVWSAANQIAEDYEGEWYLTGTTFHLVKKVSFGAEIDFESEVSVMKMERSEGDDSEKYTRILALGSTRNLPANYRETISGEAVDAIYQQRLRIPASKGSVIDAYPDMSPEEVKEQPVIFEDIYPKRIGTISEITTKEYTDTDNDTGVVTVWNAYRIKDSGLSFSKDYLLSGVELRLVFQSGLLNGMDFALNFNPDGYDETDPRSQVFEIVRNEDYGKALPNDTLKPTIGSEYVLYGFNIQLVSDLYIPEAEQELYDTAVEWQQDRLKDKSVFECPTVMQYFADHEMDLEIGQNIRLIRNLGGGRNLIPKSNIAIGTFDYLIASYPLTENWVVGQEYTITLKGVITDGQTFGVFSDHGNTWLTNLQSIGDGLFRGIGVCNGGGSNITLWNTPSREWQTYAQIDWIKVEKGNKATDWTAAPEDIEGMIRSSRIQGFEKKLINKYEATYTVGDNASSSWPDRVEESIKTLQLAGNTYQQITSGGTIYLIKQFDQVAPTDFNAYSAKASDAKYLNKQTGGTVQGDTAFQKKATAKEFVSGQFGNDTFVPGILGNGFRFWIENGLSYGQLDYLTITREMLISVLTVAEVKSVDGGMMISSANMICSKVEDIADGYKCYFDNDNDNIPNRFTVGDQAMCRRFNGANVKYYWRLVTEIGSDYILLSKIDKDGSGTPESKDNIVQFGNRIDTQRQFAIYSVAYGDAGTYYYYDVNSYDLTGKAKSYINKNGAKITGDFIIKSTGKSVSDTIDAISFGGRNYVRNSKQIQLNAGASPYTFYPLLLSEGLQSNTEYTFSIEKTEITSGTAVPVFSVIAYNTNTDQGADVGFQIPVSLDKQTATFKTATLPNDGFTLILYAGVQGSASNRTMKWTNVQLEKASKAGDWTEAPEDAQAKIDAAQGTADDAIQKYSETSAALVVLNDEINAKVSQSNFDSLNGKVNNIETEQSVQAGLINQTITKVDAKSTAFKSISVADYPNVPYSKGDIWITYDGIIKQANTSRLSGSFVNSDWSISTKYIGQDAIDAIQFGGRNYVLNSKELSVGGSPNEYTFLQLHLSESLQPNTEYTFSVGKSEILSGTNVADYSVLVYNTSTNQGSTGFFLSVSQSRQSYTFRTGDLPDNGDSLLLYTGPAGSASNRTMKWTNVQLEKASKAGDWTEAPEDAQAKIDAAQGTADSKNRIFLQDTIPSVPSGGFRAGDLWYMQSYTDYDGNINSDITKNKYQITRRWNGSDWIRINWSASRNWVEETDESFTRIIEKTGINDVGSGQTLKSLIDQTPEQIEVAVGKIQIGGTNYVKGSDVYITSGNRSFDFSSLTELRGQDITISVDVEIVNASGNRIGFEPSFNFADGSSQYVGVWHYISEGSTFKGRISETAKLQDKEIVGMGQKNIYVQCTGDLTKVGRPQLELGNKATGYRLSDEELKDSISTAQTAASNAQSTANTAISNFNNIVSDSILDPSEKQAAEREWTAVQAEYTKNYAQAVSYGVSISAYQTAYNSLNSYITPLLASMTTNSNIVATTYINTWTAYYNANVDLLNAITTKAKDAAVNEVKAGIKVTSDTVTVFGQQMKVDSTLIANAIQTNKLQVGTKFEVGTDGKIKAVDGEFSGKLTSSEGTIGGFKINAGSMESANAYGSGKFVLYPDNGFIAFIDNSGGVWSGIGANIFPGSSGLRGVARFENTESGTTANYGVYLNVANSPVNTALYMAAGHISGLAVRTKEITANATLTHDDVFVLVTGNSNKTITLPASPETGKIYYIKKGTGVGTVTVNGNGKSITITGATGGNILDGATAYPMITLIYSGSTWFG